MIFNRENASGFILEVFILFAQTKTICQHVRKTNLSETVWYKEDGKRTHR